MHKSVKNAIIIGAGPAGLTTAIELLHNSDVHPILLEESERVGGISATVCRNGNRMDMGGHRFFSKNEDIVQWWTSFLPVQGQPEGHSDPGGPDPRETDRVMLLRRRVSRIYYLRKFFDYPISLSPQTFINMGIARTVKAGVGYIGAKVVPRKENTLEDFMINRFGAPLYHMFFEDYTEKVWGVHPTKLSADWGAQRIKGLSMSKVLLQAIRSLLPRGKSNLTQKDTETSLIEQFLYPKYGPGHFWETVADEIVKLGGEIHLNSKVTAINLTDGNFESADVEEGDSKVTYSGECLFSSMPVKDLVESIRGISVPETVLSVASKLPYRDFMTVGLLVNKIKLTDKRTAKGELIPDCWIYVQERDVKIGRLQVFNNWSPFMVKDPLHTVWLGLEYFCNEGDAYWNMSDTDFIDFAKDELVKLGIIDSSDVLDAVRVRVKKAYPSYFGAYTAFCSVREWLDTIDNLYCIGRNGQHRYNNMDHSMLTAMEAVKSLLSDTTGHCPADKTAIWSVNSEESYHETQK